MMKKTFVTALILCSAVAFAQADKKPAEAKPGAKAEMKAEGKGAEMKAEGKAMGQEMKAEGGAMMGGWTPPKITKEDKAGVDAYYKAADAAWMAQDMNTVASMMSFPVTMITDGKAGGMVASWTKEQWMKEMSSAMANMPKDMKMEPMKRKYHFLSDNLVMVMGDAKASHGKMKMAWRSGEILMKKDGKWMGAVAAEGGWGDVMAAKGTGGSPMTK